MKTLFHAVNTLVQRTIGLRSPIAEVLRNTISLKLCYQRASLAHASLTRVAITGDK